MRATTSVGPPAANGTSSRTVLAGYSCACAALRTAPARRRSKPQRIRRIVPSPQQI